MKFRYILCTTDDSGEERVVANEFYARHAAWDIYEREGSAIQEGHKGKKNGKLHKKFTVLIQMLDDFAITLPERLRLQDKNLHKIRSLHKHLHRLHTCHHPQR